MLDPVKAFLSLIMLATRLQVLNCSSRFARLAVARGLSSGAASYSYGAPTTSATTGTSITRGVWRGRASASRLFSTGASANNAASADGSIVTTVAGRTLPQAVDTVTSLPRIKVHAASASAGLAPGVDMLVIPLVKVDKNASLADQLPRDALPAPLLAFLTDVIKEGDFTAEAGSKLLLRLDASVHKVKHVALVGVEVTKATTSTSSSADVFNMGVDSGVPTPSASLGRTIASLAHSAKAGSVRLVLAGNQSGSGFNLNAPGSVSQLITGMHEGAYADFRFRKLPKSEPSVAAPDTARGNWKVPHSLTLVEVAARSSADLEAEAAQGHAIASGVALARDLVGAPSNVKNPAYMAQAARQLAETLGLEIRVLGKAECEARGMGGYLSVQVGSAFEPQLIHLIYKGEGVADSSAGSGDKKAPFRAALVGKGLTFDSGGYNLKVGASSQIELMKMDMGGCAAVFGAAAALAQIKPKGVEVHFISAVCENMVSAHATRPGDVVTASNGVSIEVVNTDAEGRLTLADALVYAQREALGIPVPNSGAKGSEDDTSNATTTTDLENVAVIDLATLTGACIVGLGDKVAGLFSSSPRLRSELQLAAQRSGESVWPLPLESQYARRVKSRIADIRNVGGGGGGGSVTAALFLKHFVAPRVPWAHLDIAGPVWDSNEAKAHDGATGFGVKTLVDYVLSKSQGNK